MYDTIETQTRHQIRERVSRAAEPRLPHVATRRRVADGLRKFATRIDA